MRPYLRGWHVRCTHTAREAQATSWPRRPMNDQRRQDVFGPPHPERPHRDVGASLLSRHSPARAIVPLRGFFFSSEVQCLDVVSTESRSPAHRADYLAALATSTAPPSSALSSTLPCAIAADAASTAPFRWRSTSRRSITYTRCRRAGLTSPATWSRRARRAIASRATCCHRIFSAGIPGRARTSFATRGLCIGR